MRVVRHVGRRCLDDEYIQALASPGAVVIDALPARPNVGVRFWRAGKPVQATWRPGARDLFDFGVMLYMADELAERPEVWGRRFRFVMPVVSPARWSTNNSAFRSLLSFLTGDTYDFTWLTSRSLPPHSRHRARLPHGYDAVCLFSGGLDSLLGAIEELERGLRVVLVGHYADGVTSSAQRDLFAALKTRYGEQVELIQCRVSRSLKAEPRYPLPEKCEESHRSRSFLFLSLATSIAATCGIGKIVIAENGLIALNPPLGASRLGSLSTRTAHPKFLLDFMSCVRAVGAYDGRLENPFLYKSKTDILRGVAAWQQPLIERTVSCAHAATSVRWKGKPGIRHCGYCVPCIYRRAGMMHAGLDRAEDYCDDVFRDLPALSPAKQEDMRFVARFARHILSASPIQLRALVVSHGQFPPGIGGEIGPCAASDYHPWADMLRRWAEEFIGLLSSHGTPGTCRFLGLPRRLPRVGTRNGTIE